MSFFSLIAVLLLEHFRPLTHRFQLYPQFTRYANFLERHFNAGEQRHGIIAWLLAVAPLLVLTAGIGLVLYQVTPLLALLWNVAVLYVTLGFKHFSDTSAGIATALRDQDLERARKLLSEWEGGGPLNQLNEGEIARVVIERMLICAHKQLFGVIAWFVVLGPAGAVLYRLAHILYHKWGALDEHEFGEFGRFAGRVFDLMDWAPARMTAISFAIVGDFEDAVYCWRAQAANWVQKAQGVILASGAGALGVKLGEPLHYDGNIEYRPELGLGDEADADYVQSAVSLVWRALLLWLALLLLLTLANWAGS